jgi:hypothetical protein
MTANDRRHRVKRAAIFLAVALAIPTSVAFAKGPTGPHTGGKSAPNVTYVLKGTLSAYTAATDSSTGQITIDVKHSNYHGRKLKNQSLTFTLAASSSKVTFRHTSTLADSTATARGVILVRAPRKLADPVNDLAGAAKRIHVVVLKDLTS